MCGIAGCVSWTDMEQYKNVISMTQVLYHRGPDNEEVMQCGAATLGHRRLAIIDLSLNANQPMADKSGRYWIVHNGEIYNYLSLKKELERLGAEFKTCSDTEVILQSFIVWGISCLQRFNGMFAFAIWDSVEQKLFLARDRLGEKPLYYKRLPDNGVVFASELKALQRHPFVNKKINPRAVSQFLSLNYVLTNECIIDGVEKLPAGHFLIVERERENINTAYWNLAEFFLEKRTIKKEIDTAKELNELIDDAVKLRLVSDVPLGAFLSGGIDSSTIVAAMARYRKENHTFSIGFNESSFSEIPQARFIADYLKVSHHDEIVTGDIVNDLKRMAYFADEPFADTSFIPMYYLAQFAKKYVTVCLSGDGGDELFGGYETYMADLLRHKTQHIPLLQGIGHRMVSLIPTSLNKVSFDYKVKQFTDGYGLDAQNAHYYWRNIFSNHEKMVLIRPEYKADILNYEPYTYFEGFFDNVKDCDILDQAMYVDIKTWLVDDILHKVDRTTMAHALEARAPFLDYRLVEFAASLPSSLKIKGLRKKYILKVSQRSYLPEQVIKASKKGFNAPVSWWLLNEIHDYAKKITLSPIMLQWFNRDKIISLWEEHEYKRRDNGYRLFGLLCFGLWLELNYENKTDYFIKQ